MGPDCVQHRIEHFVAGEEAMQEEVTFSIDCQHPQCFHLRDRFSGKGRLAAFHDQSPTRYDSLLFFSPQAFTFFLPGIALECMARLNRGEAEGESLANALLYTLGDFSTKPRYREHLEVLRAESEDLKDAIMDLLKLIDESIGFSADADPTEDWTIAFCLK